MKKFVISAVVMLIIFFLVPNVSLASVEESLSQDQIRDELEKGVEEQINAIDTKEWDKLLKSLKEDGNELVKDIDVKSFINKLVTGNFELDLKTILRRIINVFFKEIRANLILMTKIMAIAVVCAVLDHMKSSFTDSSVGELAWFVCYMMVMVLVVHSLIGIIEVGKKSMEQMIRFMQMLFPILLSILIAMGGIVTSSVLHPMIALLVGMSGTILKNVMIPLILFSAIVVLVNHVSDRFSLDRMYNLAKNVCSWTLGMFFTVFVGVLAVQGALTASFDGISIRTAKYAVEAFVPIVGGLFAKTVDMVVGCSLIVKNAVGIVGLIITAMIALYPAIKILCLVFIYKLSGAILEPISNSRISACLNDIGDVLIVLFVTVTGVTLMFFLTIALLIGAGNITTMMR